jgi:hypothetical protein
LDEENWIADFKKRVPVYETVPYSKRNKPLKVCANSIFFWHSVQPFAQPDLIKEQGKLRVKPTINEFRQISDKSANLSQGLMGQDLALLKLTQHRPSPSGESALTSRWS